VWVEFLCGGRCSNLCGKVAEFVWGRWLVCQFLCGGGGEFLCGGGGEFLCGEVVNFCGGRCSNLCAGKVVGWVEFVCGEDGRVG
jgi:hypothetical protein